MLCTTLADLKANLVIYESEIEVDGNKSFNEYALVILS